MARAAAMVGSAATVAMASDSSVEVVPVAPVAPVAPAVEVEMGPMVPTGQFQINGRRLVVAAAMVRRAA